jgi:hypothetical protein
MLEHLNLVVILCCCDFIGIVESRTLGGKIYLGNGK